MITIIVAFDENRLMGTDTGLPWHIPEEFRHFKTTTMGHAIVMGRNTWFSLPKRPLPGRLNVVVSKTLRGACPDIPSAVEKAKKFNPKEVFIIGGLQLYQSALPLADRVLASKIKGKYDGILYFPELKGWREKLINEYDQFDVVEYTNLKNESSE